ncbi:hypothetical protein CR205_00280 [Alteribacter lacisalsi]|uniref:DUF58 domain-containing protein n=1 Tax=Alteribacter lacisalsi TaxID=2045244 RepID=A0A2W0HAL8_9BACI|nr:DUF58 domain-containing protein [Alteribacter lacisalsi]PYZ97080.1 hypothetical protein CR205_00280 [Alteribacter lacisalsi]
MKKEWLIESRHSRTYTAMLMLVPFLLLTAVIMRDILMASLSVFFILFVFVNRWYLRYVTSRLTIPYEHQTIRLFPGEEGHVTIPFTNQSRLPVINGTWGCHLYDHESALGKNTDDPSSYQKSLSIPPGTSRRFSVPVQAVKRGTVQVRSLEAVIYDPFRLSFVKMQYHGSFRGDVVVYPDPAALSQLKTLHLQEKGQHVQPFSLFEDVTMPRGTRPYQSKDPFNRLNWKATARTGEIQTNVYENVTLSKWTMVINVRSDETVSSTIPDLETVLSQACFAVRYAVRHQIRFDLYVNVRIPGSDNGLYLAADEGKQHGMRALEIFARLRHGQLTISEDRLLQRILSSRSEPPKAILHFGTYGYMERFYYGKAGKLGTQAILIPSEGGDADVLAT